MNKLDIHGLVCKMLINRTNIMMEGLLNFYFLINTREKVILRVLERGSWRIKYFGL